MSCVALCIKLVSWMFGHRGRRRRVLLRPHGQGAGEHEEALCPYPPRTVIVLDTNPSEERDGCALDKSEIELREVPFGNIEEQRRVYKAGNSGSAPRASTKDGEDERLNGSRMKRETTNGSTMTRTGTPSVIGQERSYYSNSGSSHGDEADVGGYGEAADGEAAEGHGGDGDEGGGEEEEDFERRRLR